MNVNKADLARESITSTYSMDVYISITAGFVWNYVLLTFYDGLSILNYRYSIYGISYMLFLCTKYTCHRIDFPFIKYKGFLKCV